MSVSDCGEKRGASPDGAWGVLESVAEVHEMAKHEGVWHILLVHCIRCAVLACLLVGLGMGIGYCVLFFLWFCAWLLY